MCRRNSSSGMVVYRLDESSVEVGGMSAILEHWGDTDSAIGVAKVHTVAGTVLCSTGWVVGRGVERIRGKNFGRHTPGRVNASGYDMVVDPYTRSREMLSGAGNTAVVT